MYSGSGSSIHRTLRTVFGRTTYQYGKFPPITSSIQFIRSIFIQTLSTPNPESLKFIPTGAVVLQDKDSTGNGFFVSKTDNQMEILRSPLAKKLFDVDGVKSVYLGTDFVTITKYAEHQWRLLRPELYDVLMEWADSGEPALTDEPILTDTTILDDDDEVVAMIKELIETKIRPAVQEDGGDIRYVGFEEESGIVTVQLAGSCVGCPSSSVTLKQGVENMLKHYIREVTSVVALEEPSNDSNDTTTAVQEEPKQQKSYEERLAAAGIPFAE
jgi:NFU1 iron-sulfur cluster scaffold homolog, mitochondrial